MGNYRPIPTKCWEAFLLSLGCTYKSTEASHDKWRCPGVNRSVIYRGAKKEVPFFHIATNLKTMGVTKEDFLAWIENNC